jgi:hypothetical protein
VVGGRVWRSLGEVRGVERASRRVEREQSRKQKRARRGLVAEQDDLGDLELEATDIGRG